MPGTMMPSLPEWGVMLAAVLWAAAPGVAALGVDIFLRRTLL